MRTLFLFFLLFTFGCGFKYEYHHNSKVMKKIVVYDFGAPWCPPCRSFEPIFENWKSKYEKDNVFFMKVNTEEDKELATKFKISSLPTVLITYDGVEVKRWVGPPKESEFVGYLK